MVKLTGREDIDVRMLGNGRPFVLELGNAMLGMPSQQALQEAQQKLKEVRRDMCAGGSVC